MTDASPRSWLAGALLALLTTASTALLPVAATPVALATSQSPVAQGSDPTSPPAATTSNPPTPAGGASGDTVESTATTRVAIDRPAAGATVPQRFTIVGWAADPEGPGSGVDAVHVYLDGEAGQGTFLGAASYGEERLDVAAQLGQPRFGLSGYSLQVEIPPGSHTVYVQARARGGPSAGTWSPPAIVDVVATPAVSVAEGGRVQPPSAGCPRAPDGSCINRPGMASPTCPQIGPNGQCLPGQPGAVPPGWVGAPAAGSGPPTSATSGICLQRDAGGTCTSTAGTSSPVGTTFTLRAETGSGMATLSWTSIPGASTYELLRCSAASGQGCTSVVVQTSTSYQLPQSPNTWYVVQARGGNGQIISTSNVVGPT